MAVLMRILAFLVAILGLVAPVIGGPINGSNQPDPNVMVEGNFSCSVGLWNCNAGYYDLGFIGTRSLRSNQGVNTAQKTLVLIGVGQSQGEAVAPSAYSPTNASTIDNFNVYDGGIYAWQDPPLGSAWAYQSFGGTGSSCATLQSCGSIWARVADIFISGGGTVPAGTFDRVIIAPLNIGSTQTSQWASGGVYDNRVCTTMRRLASKGVTPSTTNTTFALFSMNGENDGSAGVTLSQYQANMNSILSMAKACGFSGRFFVNKESWLCTGTGSNAVNTTIQNAQIGLWDSTNFWQGADADSLGTSSRRSDCNGVPGTHFNDAGMASLAQLMADKMHASGAPF